MSKRYYLANIRALLTNAFNDEELRRFCHDRPEFRPVFEGLARNTGKAEIIDRLLEYAEQKVLLEILLKVTGERNPDRYAQFQPYTDDPTPSSPAQAQVSGPSSAATHNNPRPVLHEASNQPVTSSGPEPYIENPKNLPVPPSTEIILKQMFAGYRRVIIEKEFGGGFSGGRVFLLRPIRTEDRSELPAVVKIASVSLIAQERQAYRDFIEDRLPKAIGMRDTPVLAGSSDWDGLRYPLAGSGTFAIQSLWDYCRAADIEDIRYLFEKRLLKAVETLLQFNRVNPAFSLQAGYDPVLPLNLLVQPGPIPAGATPTLLTPQALPGAPLKQGDAVRLEGFIITKVDLVAGTVTLNVPTSPAAPAASYSLRLKSLGGLAAYQVGQVIAPVEGVILETRQERLEAEAKRILGASFNPEAETLTLPDGTKLPNPLRKLPDILSQLPPVRVGTIHGDLNMENVLVDPDTRDIHLIDFASARDDHVLHDFLRLETEVLVKLIPEVLARANLGAGMIRPFYEELHRFMLDPSSATPNLPHPSLDKPFTILTIIRKAARRYFFKPEDWTEYYEGLVLYLLGALKFANLDWMARQVAFLGAGVVMGLVDSELSLENKRGFLRQPHSQTPLREGSAQSMGGTFFDFYSPFEIGLEKLLKKIGQGHLRYSDFLVYQGRLTENIRRSRRFGNTAERQAERAEVIDLLNELALSIVGISFNELCNA